jgi:hypothetical protein
MSTSPSAHRHVHVAPATSSGWFGVAVAATVAAAILGALSWSQLGAAWAAAIVMATVALVGTAVAGRHGRDAAVAFVGGTLVTIAGLYATLLVMAQFYSMSVN